MISSDIIFNSFENKKILVVGDVMIDRYLFGHVSRISPEAPVPIVEFKSEEDRLGGAANVALNIAALGAKPILCSVVGDDDSGQSFFRLMENHQLPMEGLIVSKNRMTTVKKRVISEGQHLLRIDKEQVHDLDEMDEKILLGKINSILTNQEIGAILFQDYNKGILSESLISSILTTSKQLNIPTVVDPKFKNFWAYQNVTCFKPNLKEIQDALNSKVEISELSLNEATQILNKKLNNQWTIVTLSEHGVFIHDGKIGQIIPTNPRKIADVCGAGDTVVSVAALGICSNLDLKTSAMLANLAGGQVCEKVGVVQVDKNQLKAEFEALGARD